jgi:putative phosphoribosyl transferase
VIPVREPVCEQQVPPMKFRNRIEAGNLLAKKLSRYKRGDVLVIALPRGGVPVARVVADALGAPLDILLVRKLGLPWQPELGFGGITEGDVRFVDDALVQEFGLTPERVREIAAREQREIERRGRMYRGSKAAQSVAGKVVLVIDDGLATGATMIAAVRALRHRGAAKIVIAVPVGPKSTCATLREEADEVVCLYTPQDFDAVGAWYDDFSQVSDGEVQAGLAGPAHSPAASSR